MVRRLPRKDVVVVGLGWTGSILAYELAQTGLDVVAIERGPWRDTATDFNIGTAADELRYAVRHDIFLRPTQETLTMRNNPSQTALPIRKWGSFLPGNGVGGAGVHWNGQTWRFLPDDFRIRSHMTERYGEGILPEGNHDPGLAASAMTSSSLITTSSSGSPAFPARPATSRARSSRAAIASRAPARTNTRRRR